MAWKLLFFSGSLSLLISIIWPKIFRVCSISLKKMPYIWLGEGLGRFCKGKNINLLKCLGVKMLSLVRTDCDGLCMLQTHRGIEVGAKIQHCWSCGLV